jgi:hypothetical protein
MTKMAAAMFCAELRCPPDAAALPPLMSLLPQAACLRR